MTPPQIQQYIPKRSSSSRIISTNHSSLVKWIKSPLLSLPLPSLLVYLPTPLKDISSSRGMMKFPIPSGNLTVLVNHLSHIHYQTVGMMKFPIDAQKTCSKPPSIQMFADFPHFYIVTCLFTRGCFCGQIMKNTHLPKHQADHVSSR